VVVENSKSKYDLKKTGYYMYTFIISLILVGLPSDVMAQQGGEIFQKAACSLLTQVLTEHFGSMLTVLAGTFAIISSVVGSFRMAWVLVFVSVGIFIFPNLVETFFPEISQGC
jgi:hypothetical protein